MLCCPRCQGQLQLVSERLSCSDCSQQCPEVGGIPCLLPDADRVLAEWRRMASGHLKASHKAFELAVGELLSPGATLSSTRRRLRRMAHALGENHARLEALLGKSGLAGGDAGAELCPDDPRLLYLQELVFRDWGWGDRGARENQALLEAVESVLPAGRELGTVLVLGAGACRLPYDLDRRHAPRTTIALDVSPLPFLIAQEAMFARGLTLFDFPVNPHDAESVSVPITLRAPEGPPASLHLCFADGLRPPVRAGAVDTVVTTFFIDQVPGDVRELATAVHRVLSPGGLWLNVGPLMYPGNRPMARRYTRVEVLELLDGAGFVVGASRTCQLPYLFSPGSSSGRTVVALAFAAERASAPPEAAEEVLPDWAESWSTPVPRQGDLERFAPRHPVILAIARSVDGSATIADIAARVLAPSGLPETAQLRAVRAVLLELIAASREQ